MAWITYSDVENRWPNWENMSPFPDVGDAASAQAWVGYLITDAQGELESFIPEEFAGDAAASPTSAALVSACYLRTRAKIMEWFHTTRGRGTDMAADIQHYLDQSEKVLMQWIEEQKSEEERGAVAMLRVRRKDQFWEADQNEGVEADYDL